MLDRANGALVDEYAATGLPVGCRTLCGTCNRPIEADAKGWYHLQPRPDGVPLHEATPVEQPEPTRGEQLADSVTEPYERHRSRLRRVNAYDVERMAHRLGDAAQDRLRYTFHPGQDSEKYERAFAAYYRRLHAVRRLAEALERQAGGGSR